MNTLGWGVWKDFAAADIELLENCLFLYALLEGISEMLQRVGHDFNTF